MGLGREEGSSFHSMTGHGSPCPYKLIDFALGRAKLLSEILSEANGLSLLFVVRGQKQARM